MKPLTRDAGFPERLPQLPKQRGRTRDRSPHLIGSRESFTRPTRDPRLATSRRTDPRRICFAPVCLLPQRIARATSSVAPRRPAAPAAEDRRRQRQSGGAGTRRSSSRREIPGRSSIAGHNRRPPKGDPMSSSPNQEEKALAFRALHEGEPFVIPNPWDAARRGARGARVQGAGDDQLGLRVHARPARRRRDARRGRRARRGARPRRPTCRSRSTSRTATARRPRTPRRAIARAAEAGAVGGSIEDYDPDGGLYELGHARERVAAAVEAARGARLPVHAHRPGREPHPRQPRPRRHDRPAAGLRGGRAPTSSTRPGLRSGERDPRGLRGGLASRSTCSRCPNLSRRARSSRAGAQRISVGGSLAWVAVGGDGRGGDGDPRPAATSRALAESATKPTGSLG